MGCLHSPNPSSRLLAGVSTLLTAVHGFYAVVLLGYMATGAIRFPSAQSVILRSALIGGAAEFMYSLPPGSRARRLKYQQYLGQNYKGAGIPAPSPAKRGTAPISLGGAI
jgi:hypothetical protein